VHGRVASKKAGDPTIKAELLKWIDTADHAQRYPDTARMIADWVARSPAVETANPATGTPIADAVAKTEAELFADRLGITNKNLRAFIANTDPNDPKLVARLLSYGKNANVIKKRPASAAAALEWAEKKQSEAATNAAKEAPDARPNLESLTPAQRDDVSTLQSEGGYSLEEAVGIATYMRLAGSLTPAQRDDVSTLQSEGGYSLEEAVRIVTAPPEGATEGATVASTRNTDGMAADAFDPALAEKNVAEKAAEQEAQAKEDAQVAAEKDAVAQAPDIEVAGVDEAVLNGAGQISVTENGQPVPFKNFALSIDGNVAEVGMVRKTGVIVVALD
jgi:hypothetical protein